MTVVVIIACDKLEQCGEEIIHNCFILQVNISHPFINNELMMLIEYVRALAPKISASGMFYINKQLFTSFLAVIITYVIVVLQFRQN